MVSLSVYSPVHSGPSLKSRSSAKFDDLPGLTSFNPFSEDGEDDQSRIPAPSFFSRMKESLVAPLSAVASVTSPSQAHDTKERSQPSVTVVHNSQSLSMRSSMVDKPTPLAAAFSNPAPPLVSLTPVLSLEAPSYQHRPLFEVTDQGVVGHTLIPGFPIQDDDAMSMRTTTGLNESGSVSKVIKRIRGEGLSRDYWMDDENCKECYDCRSFFTTWRRKHHCRICGQIFCSRCASNIIKGSRFGHDGMVRVCNLCLGKLAEVDDDDDDDRRSVVSMNALFPTHQMGSGSLSQSPLTTSQPFGRTDEPFNLYSIAEIKRPISESDDSGQGSRPTSPVDCMPDNAWERARKDSAPFRRNLADEDKELPHLHDAFYENSPRSKTVIDFSATISVFKEGPMSSIQFPSSQDHAIDSYISTPFVKRRVHGQPDDTLPTTELGWRTRRESAAYSQELNPISMVHLRNVLRQMLAMQGIPNIQEWEETLLRFSLRIAHDLTFFNLSHRQGEDMDFRRHVKIKKIPGGSPSDSEYVDGAVITKNVAHKQMSRLQSNPRIMLVTFPLELSRVEGQYHYFGQIVRLEKEYLANLASRIVALRPHVVMVQQSVSRLALEELNRHNIAVTGMVKPSAIQLVARMTQANVFSSMDKLALEPRLGHCSKFRIQTYEDPLIPGRRKTHMRFEGCGRAMGCTIILRGADLDTLQRVKKVTQFLPFLVQHLKLESHLWKDSGSAAPSLTPRVVPMASPGRPSLSKMLFPLIPAAPTFSLASEPFELVQPLHEELVDEDKDLPDEDAERIRLSLRIQQSTEPYKTALISVSATLQFPPPQPISRMKELDDKLSEARLAWEDEVIKREEMSYAKKSPFGHFAVRNSGSSSRYPGGSSFFHISPPANPRVTTKPQMQLKTPSDIALESQLGFVQWRHEEQRRIWEWYLRKNKDDFVVEKYQGINILEYIIPIAQFGLHRACSTPRLKYVTFYGENDCTLGQFIKESVADTLIQFLNSKAVCEGKGCDQPLARHGNVFVHNETRLFIAVEQWEGQFKGRVASNSPAVITTWSACRLCGMATPFMPVSEEMQGYSFTKFLELHFYPQDMHLVPGANCQHNIYRHHIRYFACKRMTVRFQADPVVIHEVVHPSMRIRIRPETQLELKNGDWERLHRRNAAWYSALVNDLKLTSIDAATGDEEFDARLIRDINKLITRAEKEREEISRLIDDIYKESSPMDTLALNQVWSYRQDKIVAWQHDFDKLPKPRAQPVSRHGRKSAFASVSVRSMWPGRYDMIGPADTFNMPSLVVSEAEESIVPGRRRVTGDSFASSASEASEAEPEPETTSTDLPVDASAPTSFDPPSTESLPLVVVHKSRQKSDPESDSTIGLITPAEKEREEISQLIDSIYDNSSSTDTLALNQVRSHQQNKIVAWQHDYDKLPKPRAQPVGHQSRKSDYGSVQSMGPGRYDMVGPADNHSTHLSKTEESVISGVRRGIGNASASSIPNASKPELDIASTNLPVDVSAPTSSNPPSTKSSPLVVVHEPYQELDPESDSTISFTREGAGQLPHTKGKQREANVPRGMGHVSRLPRRPHRHPSVADLVKRYQDYIPAQDAHALTKTTIAPPLESKQEFAGDPPNRPLRDQSRHHLPTTKKLLTSDFERSYSANLAPRHLTHTQRSLQQNSRIPGPIGSSSRGNGKEKDTERANRHYDVIRGRRARPVASARAKVEILDSVKDAIRDGSESDSSEADDDNGWRTTDSTTTKSSPESSSTLPQQGTTDGDIKHAVKTDSSIDGVKDDTISSPHVLGKPALSPSALVPGRYSLHSLPPSPSLRHSVSLTQSQHDMDIEPSIERNSVIKALSGFWPQPLAQSRIQVELEGEDPMSDPEHIFRDSSMIVRTDEPTSIIALALNSPQYRDMLQQSRVEKRTARTAREREVAEAFMPDDRSVAESTSTWGVVNVETVLDATDPMDDLKIPSSKLPWVISFESGGFTISCTVLYPEQFDALRRTHKCERSMIESLTRCVNWKSSERKAGSAFLKTRDDRFIAKELSKNELQTMETFAPAYFDYISSVATSGRPTLLAKVFGCYKLTFKKTDTDQRVGKSKSTQMNLLVTENLFSDRRFSKIYDLKGSTRNRYVQSTGREDEVLLDENFVEAAHLSPFYLREHSKRIVRSALYNDSQFLADMNIMDYSLVVGVDSENNELVMGIVDYIRVYTRNNILESWVGGSGFLGESKQYKERFRSAMERYFPLVPDRWMKQRAEEDTSQPDW